MDVKRVVEFKNEWHQIIKSRVPAFEIKEDENTFEAIIKMRRKLFENQNLSQYYKVSKITKEILEDIFLEPVSNYYIKLIKENGISLCDLINIHKKKHKRLGIILSLDFHSDYFKDLCRD